MLADNVVHFARLLRSAGLAVGPDRVLAGLEAIEAVGLARREDVHAALSAVMIDRHEQQALFDAAFAAFWRDPKLLEQLMAQLLPRISGRGDRLRPPRQARLADALAPPRPPAEPRSEPPREALDFEASITFSDRERLQTADFESMTAAEFELAKMLAENVPLPFAPVRRRRHATSSRGRIDLRATMLAMTRQPQTLLPRFSRPRSELPTIVVLLDVSGSMDRYARLMLHYLHGLTRRYLKVHTLTFGTRLTNITRALRHRDPDHAMALAGRQVEDWKGGTRIASCLDEFNHAWARRLLGGSAAVLLVTDGLDRDEGGDLTRAARQLRLFARQIVWLNPLLRFDGFEPRAAGVRALLPHVDRFLPVHNLASLADLAEALKTQPGHAARHSRIGGMELKGERLIPAPVATTWAALNDPETLKACIAGCESLERTGPDAFAAVVALKVGPVSARFRGNLRMSDVDPPHGYTIHFDGQGGAAGFGKGSADVKLEAQGSEATRLAYLARATVGGKMAQIGSRLVDATAAKITDDFFRAFEAQVRSQVPAGADPARVVAPVAPAPAPAPAGTLEWVLAGLVALTTLYFVFLR